MTALLPDSPWSLVPADVQLVDGLSASVGLSATTARILVSRGLSTPDDVARFFSPSLERDWLDPRLRGSR
jgi:single-stranded-DNA-specific exonuclease